MFAGIWLANIRRHSFTNNAALNWIGVTRKFEKKDVFLCQIAEWSATDHFQVSIWTEMKSF